MNIHSARPQASKSPAPVLGKSFRIERYGLTWSGSWTVENDDLVVTSRFGSRTIPVGATEDLDLAAQAVMGKIVIAWRRTLAPNYGRRK
jgi:hypothetical protein